MPLQEFFGETLARLQPRRSFGRAKDGPAAARELVHHAECERQLGPDHC